MEQVAVITVLSSLYGAVTVGLQPSSSGTRVALAMDGDRHHFRRNFSHQPIDFLFHPASFFSALSGAFPRAVTLHDG